MSRSGKRRALKNSNSQDLKRIKSNNQNNETNAEKPKTTILITQQNTKQYDELLELDDAKYIHNNYDFDCPICLDTIKIGNGIVLRECLHNLCKTCFINLVKMSDGNELKCPYRDSEYLCNEIIQEREMRSIVPIDIFDKYLTRSLGIAEQQILNTYHCKKPNCEGWCIVENILEFECETCKTRNCIPCLDIHPKTIDCATFRDIRDSVDDVNGSNGRLTANVLQNMLKNNSSMRCPKCKIMIYRDSGCDAVVCAACKVNICWITRGLRWGPKGRGDISGGCRCNVNGIKCHPQCKNCH